jgi:hypothetical protein
MAYRVILAFACRTGRQCEWTTAMGMTPESRGRKAKTRLCVYELRITLQEIRPPIRRLLQVANTLPLNRLRDALQTVIGWTDSHLHRFEKDGTHWGVPEEDEDDSVEHEKILPAWEVVRPVCLAGERHCPPQDAGGVPGYAEFLEVIFEPGHEEYEHYVRRAGGPSPLNRSAGRFQPDEFNIMAVNDALSRMRRPSASKRNDRPVLSRNRFEYGF